MESTTETQNIDQVQDKKEEQKTCKRHGCNKKYFESENTENSCNFHNGVPMFHDTKKGWTCCKQIVYDWDEFAKIPTCSVGQHQDIDPMQGEKGQDGFFKSNTVNTAKIAIDKSEQKNQEVKKISDYNKQVEVAKKEEPSSEKKVFVTDKGNHKCTNKGCMKEFSPNENNEESCSYHPGEPVFHDLKKYWTCCKKETWDWDEFVKLPTCTKGKHNPKLVN